MSLSVSIDRIELETVYAGNGEKIGQSKVSVTVENIPRHKLSFVLFMPQCPDIDRAFRAARETLIMLGKDLEIAARAELASSNRLRADGSYWDLVGV